MDFELFRVSVETDIASHPTDFREMPERYAGQILARMAHAACIDQGVQPATLPNATREAIQDVLADILRAMPERFPDDQEEILDRACHYWTSVRIPYGHDPISAACKTQGDAIAAIPGIYSGRKQRDACAQIYAVILKMPTKDGKFFLSSYSIEAALRIPQKSPSRCMAALVRNNLLEVTKPGGRYNATEYRIIPLFTYDFKPQI